MKRYKSFFLDGKERFPHRRMTLLEAIINPTLYLKDIEATLDRLLLKVRNKNYSDKKLCIKFQDHFFFNKLKFNLDPVLLVKEINIDFGINEANCINKKPFAIHFSFNKNITRIQNDEIFCNEFKKWFLFVLKHELVHRGQNLAINDNKISAVVMSNERKKLKDNLAHKQEIMARAWEIIELFKLQNNMQKSDIDFILKNPSKYSSNQTLRAYTILFEKDSKELRLLYKYMYLYAQED